MEKLQADLAAVKAVAAQEFLIDCLNGVACIVTASYSGDDVFRPDPAAVNRARKTMREVSLLLAAGNPDDAANIRVSVIHRHCEATDLFDDSTLTLKLFGKTREKLEEEYKALMEREEAKARALREEQAMNSKRNPIKDLLKDLLRLKELSKDFGLDVSNLGQD